jgi:beta-glucosidase
VPGLKDAWDYIGINYYSRSVIRAGRGQMGVAQVTPPEDSELSTMGWQVWPEGFYHCLIRLKQYNKPVYITENGIGTDDDEQRRSYLVRHMKQAHRALSDGLDLRSYFHWSFQDNFEWAEGFRQKFGLIAMEEGTLNRILKPSAHMFREIAQANAVTPDIIERYLEGDR